MNAPLQREYDFHSRSQWEAGLRRGFDLAPDHSLRPAKLLAARPNRVGPDEPASAIVGGDGVSEWRSARCIDDWNTTLLRRHETGSAALAEFEIGGLLARGVRWIGDEEYLWSFDGRVAGRTRRSNLHTEPEIDLLLAAAAELERDTSGFRIADLTSDGCRGIWALLCIDGDGKPPVHDWLIHLDEDGECNHVLRVPPDAGAAQAIGTLDGGRTLAVLAGRGKFILLIDTRAGGLRRAVPLGGFTPSWHASQLACDGRNRMALLGRARDGEAETIYLLDADGNLVQGPLAALPSAGVVAVSLGRDGLWFATDAGAWLLPYEVSAASALTSAECHYLAPLLLSPETDQGRGWLRAELDLKLPAGTVLEARYAGTSDDRAARRIEAVLKDAARTSSQRMTAAWKEFDDSEIRVHEVTPSHSAGTTIAIPLFAVEGRWLLFGFSLRVPSGVAPPSIARLRILYPNTSIEQNIPAIFRGAGNDPGGVLRRILGALEVTTQSLDERIRAIGAGLDPERAPDPMLNYIGGWLGIPWHDSLAIEARRRLLTAAAEILGSRGTRAGLTALLSALTGRGARIRIQDMTADYAVARLGGRRCRGSPMPLLLAGIVANTATLGGKAVLGRARLPCAGTAEAALDPLASIRAQLRITLTVNAATKRSLEPLLGGLLREYLPIGVAWRVIWRIRPVSEAGDGDSWLLDANGPGALGTDSEIGRTVLTGAGTGQLRDRCLPMRFALS